jgi:hypothetical protein
MILNTTPRSTNDQPWHGASNGDELRQEREEEKRDFRN